MNYQNPELVERLASEYALGTLRGPARRRFERLAGANPAARGALQRWEDDWVGMSLRLAPTQPSPKVWAGIQSRLFGESERRAPVRRTWRLVLAAGLAAVVLVAGLLIRQQQLAPRPVAALGADATHPVWLIEHRQAYASLRIRVTGAVERRAGKSYELWALPKSGAPVSLGLLPDNGTLERTLTATQRSALVAADKVAVSVEPPLGSPTGQPTGPVVLVGTVAHAG